VLVLRSKLAKQLAQVLQQLTVQPSPLALRNEHHMVFACPRRVTETVELVRQDPSFCVLGGSRAEVSSMDTPTNAKLQTSNFNCLPGRVGAPLVT